MASPIISVQNIGKKYRIGAGASYGSLRDSIAHIFTTIKQKNTPDEFWALKDVSFDINKGQSIGIIGRNGAGKSTILKILSQITPPTTGKVIMNGRVASLLEVGTGFHQELSGRENIYLNGAILGMSRVEIKKKFDEIIDFAGIEKFLDTPVKRYSSGMYVRLAFAVAAHLEPEILIVDEVLAVGDVEFQKKCLGRMQAVNEEGRTVIFVSHNMIAIKQLCQNCIYLDNGQIKTFSETKNAIDLYLNEFAKAGSYINFSNQLNRQGSQKVVFESLRIQDSAGNDQQEFSLGDEIKLELRLRKMDPELKKLRLAVELRSSDGLKIANMVDLDSHFELTSIADQEAIGITLKDIRFFPDTYYISIWAGSHDSKEDFDYITDCLRFQITDGGKLTTRELSRRSGLFFLTPEWRRLSK